jgi:hypothetical protein
MYSGISNGDGTFTYRYTLIGKSYTYVSLADFTGDGKADLFLCNSADGTTYPGVGDGAGAFTFHYSYVSPGHDIGDVGDLTGDGIIDVILYNPANGHAATGISRSAWLRHGGTRHCTTARTGSATRDRETAMERSCRFRPCFWSLGYDTAVFEDVRWGRYGRRHTTIERLAPSTRSPTTIRTGGPGKILAQ